MPLDNEIKNLQQCELELDEGLQKLLMLGLIEPVLLSGGETGYRLKSAPVDSYQV